MLVYLHLMCLCMNMCVYLGGCSYVTLAVLRGDPSPTEAEALPSLLHPPIPGVGAVLGDWEGQRRL